MRVLLVGVVVALAALSGFGVLALHAHAADVADHGHQVPPALNEPVVHVAEGTGLGKVHGAHPRATATDRWGSEITLFGIALVVLTMLLAAVGPGASHRPRWLAPRPPRIRLAQLSLLRV